MNLEIKGLFYTKGLKGQGLIYTLISLVKACSVDPYPVYIKDMIKKLVSRDAEMDFW